MTTTSWLEINLSRMAANVAHLRSILTVAHSGVGDAAEAVPALCAVVKSDAYGLGASVMARQLVSLGVDMLAVYSPDQAHQLVQLGVLTPILILMPARQVSPDLLGPPDAAEQIHLTIHDTEQFQEIDLAGQVLKRRIPVHLYLDTGMCRSGLSDHQFAELLTKVPRARGLRLAGVCTHLSSADEDPDRVDQQIQRLDRLLATYRDLVPSGVRIHVANTFATLRHQRYHRSMVRVGLGLWGYGPGLIRRPPILPQAASLQPIVRWVSRIVHIRRYPSGSLVGYGGTHRLKHDSWLAVVPAGHGDGYPVALSNRATVNILDVNQLVRSTASVIGRVSMDQIVINLTPHGDCDPSTGASVGDLVELISDDPASDCALPNLAKLADSSCYEMLCRLSPRVPRYHRHSPPNTPTQIMPNATPQPVIITSSSGPVSRSPSVQPADPRSSLSAAPKKNPAEQTTGS